MNANDGDAEESNEKLYGCRRGLPSFLPLSRPPDDPLTNAAAADAVASSITCV